MSKVIRDNFDNLSKAKKSKEEQHTIEVALLKNKFEAQLSQIQEELDKNTRVFEELRLENEQNKIELARAKDQVKKGQSTESIESASSGISQKNAYDIESLSEPRPSATRIDATSLRRGLPQPNIKEKELETKIESLIALVTEGERTIQQLRHQEKLLKDELRNMDRRDKRADQNLEYLKNIVLSFVESDNKLLLIPVFSQVLQLSPDEVNRLKKKLTLDGTLEGNNSAFGIGSFGLL
jgi:hypothetical protein